MSHSYLRFIWHVPSLSHHLPAASNVSSPLHIHLSFSFLCWLSTWVCVCVWLLDADTTHGHRKMPFNLCSRRHSYLEAWLVQSLVKISYEFSSPAWDLIVKVSRTYTTLDQWLLYPSMNCICFSLRAVSLSRITRWHWLSDKWRNSTGQMFTITREAWNHYLCQ